MSIESKSKYDVVIVGGGPSGSSLAIRLALNGGKVLLVEQKKFPRGKLCGEFISPECLTHFKELGVFEDMLSAGGIHLNKTVFYARNGRGISIPSEWFGQKESFSLGLSRAEMDVRLLDRARETGVEVLEETQAVGLLIGQEKVFGVNLKNGDSINTNITIDATGRTRALARKVEKEKRKRADYVAFKTHIENANVPNDVCEIYVYRGGYGGCSRVENDLYNFCFIASSEDAKRFGGNPEKVMREIVFTNKQSLSSLGEARIVKEWHAVTIESFGRGRLVPCEGLLTVGDSAAFIDPFTGSGMLLALESAKIAANVINKNQKDFQVMANDYRNEYGAAFDKRLRVCSWLRYAAFVPFFAETTIKALSFSSLLRRRLAKATRQTETVKRL